MSDASEPPDDVLSLVEISRLLLQGNCNKRFAYYFDGSKEKKNV